MCRRSVKPVVKARGSTAELLPVLADWSSVEGRGIPGGEVKFVEIGRNTSGEGALLDGY